MIDRGDVQSLIVRPVRADHLEVAFLAADDQAAIRRLCAAAVDGPLAVTTAADLDALGPDDPRRGQATAVGLTMAGLRLAGISARAAAALPAAFAAGMEAAAATLGDVGPSAPGCWDPPFGPGGAVPHAVVLRYRSAPVDEAIAIAGVRVLDRAWPGARIGDGIEPFGFRDGISEPVLAGSAADGGDPEVTPGNGIWDPVSGTWRPVQAGEAILGHVDESGVVSGTPDAAHLERNGSYLVIRRLEQDVDGFWAACAGWAEELGAPSTAETVAEQLVGRTRSGAPLGRSGGPTNDFLYRDHRFGPVAVAPAAHIRRSNPRDDMAFAEKIVSRHLLWRRGMAYREPAGGGRPERQGLLFVAGCADLQRQFEFVQARWLQDGDRFALGPERDPITGQRNPVAPGSTPEEEQLVSISGPDGARCRRPLPAFVTTRGGAYVLLPAPSALRLLAGPGPRP